MIVGAQTGPGAKPVDPAWVKDIIIDCGLQRVPLFIKDKLAERFPVQEYPELKL